MGNWWDTIIKGLATVGGVIAGAFGGWPGTMTVLVIFMAADYIMGCICALSGKSPKTDGGHFLSSVAFQGLLKKGVIMLVVLLAVQLDKATGSTAVFQTAATFFYIANEGFSILENCALMGVPVPESIRNALEALKRKNDGIEDDQEDQDKP